MKTNALFSLCIGIILCQAFFLTSCSESNEGNDDIIWDFAPINFIIAVQDAEGNDLLNPLTEGHILEQDIKAIYQGKEYKLNEQVAQTRDYLAILRGLQAFMTEDGRYMLFFGELDGTDTYDNETLTLDWGDGTTDVITFSSRLTWNSPEDPEFNRHFYLNGVEQESSTFLLTKEPGTSPAWIRSSWSIVDADFYIDAEDKTDIHADLQTAPYQIGCSLQLDSPSSIFSEGDKGVLRWLDSDNQSIIGRALTIKRIVNFAEFTQDITDKYQSYPPDAQIEFYMAWEIELGKDVRRSYDVFAVHSPTDGYTLWIYEDLTKTYQAQYPDLQIEKVIRTLVGKMTIEE